VTLSAPQVVHLAAGRPLAASCGPLAGAGAICWQCGGRASRGRSLRGWMSKGCSVHADALAPESDVVCEACVFVSSRTSPVPGRPPKPGKKMGGNYRNYTHLGERGERGEWRYTNASKGEKSAIRDFLFAPPRGPWFAAIAESGQKHVLPFAPINSAGGLGGVVRFESSTIYVPPHAAADVEAISAMLTAGATKAGIASGHLTAGAWQWCGADMIREFEAAHGARLRGCDWFRLAIWLAQRDEAVVTARLAQEKAARTAAKASRPRRRARKEICDGRRDDGQAQDRDGGRTRRAAARGAGGEVDLPTQAIRSNRERDPAGVGDIDDSRRVGDDGSPIAEDAIGQLELFGAP